MTVALAVGDIEASAPTTAILLDVDDNERLSGAKMLPYYGWDLQRSRHRSLESANASR
jgi:hypothetical protein